MIILQDEKVIFIHVPKCGGTSVSFCLDAVSKWNDIFVGATEVGEFLNKTWAMKFRLRKHSTPSEIRESIGFCDYRAYKKFIFVRDPIHRFLSAYNFMVRHIAQRAEWVLPGCKMFELNKYKSFDDFLFSEFLTEIVKNREAWGNIYIKNLEHARCFEPIRLFIPQVSYFDFYEHAEGRFSFFKLEDGCKFNEFMESMGVNRNPALSVLNANEDKKVMFSKLHNKAVERLCDLYGIDFVTFGYQFPCGFYI